MSITKTRHEAAAERIRRGIIAGEFQPGQRLKQQELARQFGCSVIPVREALHQLAAEGFVVLDPQKGARVVELNSRMLEEIYEVRIRLESWAAALAAKRMTPEAAARTRAILDKMDRPKISVAEWVALNLEFHDSLYVCAGQEFLRKMIMNMRQTVEPYLRLDLAKVGNLVDGRRQHRRIFQACLRGDAKAAERETAAHLQSVAQRLVRYLRHYGK
ncbi:MAG TPA: GntR family transcriptional regulator [Candidatus Methylomirabilis sp.]|nr:GntR family transcriptional regulator [Candidatus Methylomirabilis sp.]